jgi:hypothetical protein
MQALRGTQKGGGSSFATTGSRRAGSRAVRLWRRSAAM